MRDITLRALDVLASADTIAAEDTRNTAHLLTHYGISPNRLLALHRHNERHGAEKVIGVLSQGKAVALVTDAGTPAVSDPGALLVDMVCAACYRVIPIPGASAAVAALSASGFSFPHFLFYGFLPSKSAARRKALHELREHPYTLVFYEAPHRILECVEDLLSIFGAARGIVFARELTKLFENIHRCTLAEATAWLQADPNNQRGEFVLLISGATQPPEADAETRLILTTLLDELPLKKAVQLTARITGDSRNKLYAQALQIKQIEE